MNGINEKKISTLNLKICLFSSITECTKVSVSGGVGASNSVLEKPWCWATQGAERTPLLSKLLLREDHECDPRLCQWFK